MDGHSTVDNPPTRSPLADNAPAENPRTDAPRTLVGICTYNEAGNIREMLTRVAAALPDADILVVDDGSPDGTAELVRQFAAQHSAPGNVNCHVREDRGLGGAIRAAMQTAITERYQLFCNLDADLSHDPADLPRLVQAVLESDVDVAVGSRYVPGGQIHGWPTRRKWMSRFINSLAKRKANLPVNDASGSFRCYRVACLERLDWQAEWSNGYSFIQQILLRLKKLGATFTEVPITFTERVQGNSKLDLREAVRSGWTVLRLS
ncbi:polyprenol monophosphomannose synthase [Neorhodopirellula lusitana]|uniref:polyprenol monophosphomannose synthase n=1 Tax=Neorhodopirellula lusitana TaxID=445327 RepID=UPI00384E680A